MTAYAKTQGLWPDPAHRPDYSQTVELDLSLRRHHGRFAVAARQGRIETAFSAPTRRVGTPRIIRVHDNIGMVDRRDSAAAAVLRHGGVVCP